MSVAATLIIYDKLGGGGGFQSPEVYPISGYNYHLFKIICATFGDFCQSVQYS